MKQPSTHLWSWRKLQDKQIVRRGNHWFRVVAKLGLFTYLVDRYNTRYQQK